MHLRQLYLPASSSKLQKYHQFLCSYAQVVHSVTKTQAGVMIAKMFLFLILLSVKLWITHLS